MKSSKFKGVLSSFTGYILKTSLNSEMNSEAKQLAEQNFTDDRSKR